MAGTRTAIATFMLTLTLVALAPSAGCNVLDLAPLVNAKATVAETFETGAAPQIIVETFNGSIDISNGKEDEVIVEVTKHAGGINQQAAEAALDEVEVSLVQKDNTIHVTARNSSPMHGNRGAAVVIAAPKGARLRLASSNGAVVCEGIKGSIEANTSNGKLEIVDATGSLELTTSNGPIEVEATDAVVEAKTSNGRIQFTGTLAAGDQTFRTSNGPIKLALPADSQFKLDASTSNGNATCEFPIETSGKSRRTRLKGTVGDAPSSSLSVVTSNGPITIRKDGNAQE